MVNKNCHETWTFQCYKNKNKISKQSNSININRCRFKQNIQYSMKINLVQKKTIAHGENLTTNCYQIVIELKD